MKADKEKNDALEAKRKYLQENTDLQTLYRYLVSSKLISPDDFWSLHHIPIVGSFFQVYIITLCSGLQGPVGYF